MLKNSLKTKLKTILNYSITSYKYDSYRDGLTLKNHTENQTGNKTAKKKAKQFR